MSGTAAMQKRRIPFFRQKSSSTQNAIRYAPVRQSRMSSTLFRGVPVSRR